MNMQTVNLRRKAEALTTLAREKTFTPEQCAESVSILEEALVALNELSESDTIHLEGQLTKVGLARKVVENKAALLRIMHKANYQESAAGGRHVLRHL